MSTLSRSLAREPVDGPSRRSRRRSWGARQSWPCAGRRPRRCRPRRQARYVLVDGTAGIGKSRLVREFLAAAQTRAPAIAILQGRCPATGRGLSYWALGEVLRRACGIGLDDRAEDAEERLRDGLARILAPLELTKAESEETLNALATSAGIVIPGNPFERGEPRFVPIAITHAWARIPPALRAARRRDPRHRGPPLGRICADLGIARDRVEGRRPIPPRRDRPPRVPGSGAGVHGAARHGNGRGSVARRRRSPRLVDALLPSSALSGDLRATVVARAEGNPYFLEETVRHLADAGSSAIPDSIQAVLVARIEALPLAERRVLQEAAVVGRVFWEGPVRQALGALDIGDLRGPPGRTRPDLHPSDVEPVRRGRAELQARPPSRRSLRHDDDGASGAVARVCRSLAGTDRGRSEGGACRADRRALPPRDRTERRRRRRGRTQPIASGFGREPFRYLMLAGSTAHQRYAIDRAIELHESALRQATSDAERARALAALGQDHESGLDGPGSDRRLPPGDRGGRSGGAAGRRASANQAWGCPDDGHPLGRVPGTAEPGRDRRVRRRRPRACRGRRDPPVVAGDEGRRGHALGRCPSVGSGVRRRTVREAVTAALDGARQLGLDDLAVVAGRLSGQLEYAAGRYARSGAAFRALVPQLDVRRLRLPASAHRRCT